jgi:hypothetical protein
MLRSSHCLDNRLTDGGKIFSFMHWPLTTTFIYSYSSKKLNDFLVQFCITPVVKEETYTSNLSFWVLVEGVFILFILFFNSNGLSIYVLESTKSY